MKVMTMKAVSASMLVSACSYASVAELDHHPGRCFFIAEVVDEVVDGRFHQTATLSLTCLCVDRSKEVGR